MERLVTVIIAITFVLSGCMAPKMSQADTGTIIFQIGIINESPTGFPDSSFKGVDDYKCTVGVDCSIETFPPHIYNQPARRFGDSLGVAFVTIFFELNNWGMHLTPAHTTCCG